MTEGRRGNSEAGAFDMPAAELAKARRIEESEQESLAAGRR